MKRGTEMSRRALLRGLSAAGVALPFFSSMSSALAAPKKPQKRFVAMFTPNGTVPSAWAQQGSETNFQLGQILSPLNQHKQRLNILHNLSYIAGGPGDNHQRGMGQFLTGSQLTPGSTKGGCKSCPPVAWASGISIDQHIAGLLEKEAKAEGRSFKYKSLQFGVQSNVNNIWGRMSYAGRDKPLTPTNDPYATFKQIFAGVGDDQRKFAELKARRQSILDAVRGELKVLKNTLAQQDQQRLDQHLTSVREVEKSVTTNKDLSSCKIPTLTGAADRYNQTRFPNTGKLQMQLLTTALICGITPVASLQWASAVSNLKFSWLGLNNGHHSYSHLSDNDRNGQAALIKINNWYAQQFKFLLDELANAKDPGGTSVLDNTVLLWGNELGKGNSHTLNNIPFVMAGNVNGYFRTGRNIAFKPKTANNHLLVTLANAYGDTGRQTFNHGSFRGGLSQLKA